MLKIQLLLKLHQLVSLFTNRKSKLRRLIKPVYTAKINTGRLIQTGLRPKHDVITEWGYLQTNGLMYVSGGYAFNLCTPKYSIFDLFIIGTPDGIRDHRSYADGALLFIPTLIHDWSSQFRFELLDAGITFQQLDIEFRDQMELKEFALTDLYYRVIVIATWIKIKFFKYAVRPKVV